MKNWEQVANVVFNLDHIQYVMYDEKDSSTVILRFTDGHILTFKDGEAVEMWRIFSKERGWREDV